MLKKAHQLLVQQSQHRRPNPQRLLCHHPPHRWGLNNTRRSTWCMERDNILVKHVSNEQKGREL